MKNKLVQSGEHERQLRRHFRQFDIDKESKGCLDPVTILIFVNRSGSSMICEHLRATGKFSGFGEPFNHELVIERSRKYGLESFEAYLVWLMKNVRKPGTQFGMKASLEQVLMLLRCDAVPRFFSNCRWIFVQRLDIVSQAVSLSIARQTNQWHSFESSSGIKPQYRFEELLHSISEISEIYSNSLALAAMLGLKPYHLAYERFIEDKNNETKRLAEYLGEQNVEVDAGRLRLQKQGDGTNLEFHARFLEDFRAWSQDALWNEGE